LSDREELKAAVATRALDFVQPGMVLGLGSGTTMRYFVEGLGRRVAEGMSVTAVPTSRATAALARSLKIPIVEDPPRGVDLDVDGADEIDPELRLIKGYGGALVREKLVAAMARRVIIIADASKLVPRLGRGVIPVEVIPFLWRATVGRLSALGASCSVRGGTASPFLTDNGNMVVDLTFAEPPADPSRLARQLKKTVGVVDHGIFIDLADTCVVAGEDGLRMLGSIP